MPAAHLSQQQADDLVRGALPAEELSAVLDHASGCRPCATLVHDAGRLASLLALSGPVQPPPSRLRGRVLQAAGIARPRPFQRAIGFGRTLAGVAAVVVAVAAFTGMVTMRSQFSDLRSQNGDLQTQIDAALSQKVEIAALTRQVEDQQAVADDLRAAVKTDSDLFLALISPRSKVAEVVSFDETNGSIGRFIWDDDQKRAWFVAGQLPRRPYYETYQLWVNAGGKYFSLGTFEPDDEGFARYETTLPEGLNGYDTAVVTIEQSGGSSVREGPAVFFVSDLSRLSAN